jgi:tRNA(Ile)-lysidine synthase
MTQLLLPTSSLLLEKRNLLAFSAGIDSSALFFLLLEHDIPFDIALVNYATRAQSDVEEAHAIALAKRYGKRCYTIRAPAFKSNFEKQARDFRYAFFEKIIIKHRYDTLLTAHQLDDQLEWFLMRLAKGAGLGELIGMEPVQARTHYTLVRPLLSYPKERLLEYLQARNHPYFIDESNANDVHERNRFRQQFARPLMQAYAKGIAKSFEYLTQDKRTLDSLYETRYAYEELHILYLHHPDAKVRACDQTLKTMGYLLSAAARKEIEHHDSLVVGHTWAIEQRGKHLYIAPYRTIDMPKAFKERCRLADIPPKIRPYLYETGIKPEALIDQTDH